MIKRRISLALVVAMLLTLLMPTLAFGVVDYSGHWAEETIQEWFDNDKLNGYEDGSFRPDTQITRAEFMTMVNNAFEFTEKAEVNFKDVDSNDWFYLEVQKAVKAGYLLGYEDNTARPGNKISRQEAALIIARIKELSDYASGVNIFVDKYEIASWAKGGVGAVAKEKLMIGYEDSTFRPLRFISRVEALVTIDRSYEETAPIETTPATGGSGGSGGSGGGSGRVTTQAAILSNFTIADSTTQTAISTPAELTTSSAIFTTTSSAITVSAITVPTNANIAVTVKSPSDAITTSSAINGEISIVLNEVGDYTIELVVSVIDTGSIDYIDTKYTFIVRKE